jgi:hypothetical protein
LSAQSPSIFLATPCYGGLAHALFMRSVLALRPACAARRIGLHLELGGGEALIGRARAAMLAKFLASPASHLLFVDADLGFAPQAVFRLLDANRDVIGGVYPAKVQPDAAALVLELDPLEPPDAPDADGFCRVASVGAGFLLIVRPAAQRISEAHPQLQARLGDVHDAAAPMAAMVFDSFVDPASGRYLADHQAFCHRWRALGCEVWADLRAELSHVGAVVHRADPAAIPALA